MLVSQAVVFYTFSDVVFHSRKPCVNLLKNMVNIIAAKSILALKVAVRGYPLTCDFNLDQDGRIGANPAHWCFPLCPWERS